MKDDHKLEQLYLECWEDVKGKRGFVELGRQILHCTFGSVLTHPTFKQEVMQVLNEYRTTYDAILADHFARHLKALKAGM